MSPTSKSPSSKTLKSLLGQHELKLLNVSVIIYVCFGAFVFHLMGEFKPDELLIRGSPNYDNATSDAAATLSSRHQSTGNTNDLGNNKNRRTVTSLAELRQSSVERMWNITNQLNILYENNWTRLVMDELVEFERKLMVTLERESRLSLSMSAEESDETELKFENDNDDSTRDQKDEDDNKNSNKRSRRQSQQAEIKSIKRSIVHSIATITTIGSPSGGPTSPWGKLATVVYGAMGIPMLFYTVTKTGDRLAQSSVNLLLILRHYCLSLPAHYICCCCGVCNPFKWLSWLLYCCCCCCCAYLWCPKKQKRRSGARSQEGCCCHKEAPKLRLVDWSLVSGEKAKSGQLRRRRSRLKKKFTGGARRASGERWLARGDGYTSAACGHDGGFMAPTGNNNQQQQKSVRFAGSRGNLSQVSENSSNNNNNNDDNNQDNDSDTIEPPYSFNTFTTCLTLLIGYLLIGAYVQSRDSKSISLIESLYDCYQLLSITKLPDSFTMSNPMKNPIDTYKSLNSEPAKQLLIQSKVIKTEAESWMDFGADLAYLLLGLHLIAMFGHLTKYYRASNDFFLDCEDDDEEGDSDSDGDEIDPKKSHCNGQVNSMVGTLSGQVSAGNFMSNASEALQVPRVSGGAGGYLVQAANFHQSSPSMSDQIDLAELLVVQNQNLYGQTSVASGGGGAMNQQAQITSDMSMTSDRSSDPRSLCLHHQQQLVGGPLETNVDAHGNGVSAANLLHDLSSQSYASNTICSSTGHLLQHHHNHLSIGGAGSTSCISSGERLNQLNGHNSSRAGSRQSTMTRPVKQVILSPGEQHQMTTNGFEQDSNTLDTNSNNTTSSMTSSINPRRIGFQVPVVMQDMHQNGGGQQNGFHQWSSS